MFAIVRLRNEQVFGVDAEVFRVELVEGVFCIDDRADATLFLTFCNGVNGEGGLSRRFGTVDFHDASFGVAAYAEREVEVQAAAGYGIDLLHDFVTELHHGALAVGLVQSVHRQLEGFHFVCVYSHVYWF